jgi:hypothetical protein
MGAIIPFMGFTPSIDPTAPGCVLDCSNMVPTMRGMKAAPSPVKYGNPPFPSQVTGAASCELLNGTYRTFVGNATDLYEVVGSANNKVTRASGAYTGGLNQWRFAQFGNASLAVNGTNLLQQSISSGLFADVAGSPVAPIVEVVQGFVFLLSTTDGTYGVNPHGWWCSGLYDQTNWTPAQATQCARGVIVDTPGGITAGRALGTNIVIFKQLSMFYGSYQGPPVIWAMNLISPIVGTPSQECVINVGTSLIFLGTDCQVYSFDGTRPVAIGDDVFAWLRTTWSPLYQASVQSFKDTKRGLIFWYFCSNNNSSGIPDKCLVYNYLTGKFGRADAVVETACQSVSGQITWDGLGSLPGVTTWDTMPKIPYNSAYWSQLSVLPSIIDATHTLQSLSGVATNSSLTTGWFGDDAAFTYLQGILPRFSAAPQTCGGSAALLKTLGTTPTYVNLPAWYDGEIACDFSSRWTSVTLNFTGDHEILGAMPRMESAGAI